MVKNLCQQTNCNDVVDVGSGQVILAHFHFGEKKKKEKRKHKLQNMTGQMYRFSFTDFGLYQGHLTRFLSFGLGLSVTAIEADANLVSMARKFDGQLHFTLEKERLRQVTLV